MGLVTSRMNLASDFIANSLRQELIVLENCRRAEMRKNIMSLSCLSWLVLHREQLRGRPKADVKSSWVSCTTPPTCNHKIQNDYEFWGNLGFWVLKDAKVTTISNHNLKAWTCLGIFFPNCRMVGIWLNFGVATITTIVSLLSQGCDRPPIQCWDDHATILQPTPDLIFSASPDDEDIFRFEYISVWWQLCHIEIQLKEAFEVELVFPL